VRVAALLSPSGTVPLLGSAVCLVRVAALLPTEPFFSPVTQKLAVATVGFAQA
jgi:hypothetical protein